MNSMVAMPCSRIDNLISQIKEACNMNAALIYCVHGIDEFHYLMDSDKDLYRREMKRLRNELKFGTTVSNVRKGFDLVIEDITLYPLEIKIVGRPCVEYTFLIKSTGTPHLGRTSRGEDTYDSNYTPYFFLNRKTRDDVISWIQGSS